MSRYLVNYNHPDWGSIIRDMPERWGIADIKNGFWVSLSGKINPFDDLVYWIPISQVRYIKIKENYG